MLARMGGERRGRLVTWVDHHISGQAFSGTGLAPVGWTGEQMNGNDFYAMLGGNDELMN